MRTFIITGLLIVGILGLPRPSTTVTMSIVTVTAYSYNSCRAPNYGVTSSGQRVKEGIVALSRDVEDSLNLQFGNRVLLHGLGVFEFSDRMASHWRNKADIFLESVSQARRFGVKRHVVLVKLV
jgi:3D (Asp-Asp-Asp) domain-containing protein|uniref:3D domain-containing protein n=1 Tax=Desulfobacca acetoxidans TaxID=60893 RepID=A0A7C5ERZ8_9BACT